MQPGKLLTKLGDECAMRIRFVLQSTPPTQFGWLRALAEVESTKSRSFHPPAVAFYLLYRGVTAIAGNWNVRSVDEAGCGCFVQHVDVACAVKQNTFVASVENTFTA